MCKKISLPPVNSQITTLKLTINYELAYKRTVLND